MVFEFSPDMTIMVRMLTLVIKKKPWSLTSVRIHILSLCERKHEVAQVPSLGTFILGESSQKWTLHLTCFPLFFLSLSLSFFFLTHSLAMLH